MREQNTLDRATYVLAQACMKKNGFSWPAPLPLMGTPRSPNERRYGVLSEPTVAEYGYQLPPALGVTRKQAQDRIRGEEKRKKKMTAAMTTAYTGESGDGSRTDPQGGCYGRARSSLGISDQQMSGSSLVAQITTETWERTRQDARAMEADRAWSACMQRTGYRYSNPHEAAADPRWVPHGRPDFLKRPSGAEIETAEADIRCKRKVSYVAIWQRVETTFQIQSIATHETALARYRAAWKHSLAKSTKVLHQA
ncbi:hypothetical protein [Streptomyces werraensis]|uniref:hypothetical protein n=1 Tax=Streptomyces werraensis TaxID=68284 RepID=UPI003419ADB8